MQVSAWEAPRCYSCAFYLSYDFKISEIDFLKSGSIYAVILCLWYLVFIVAFVKSLCLGGTRSYSCSGIRAPKPESIGFTLPLTLATCVTWDKRFQALCLGISSVKGGWR